MDARAIADIFGAFGNVQVRRMFGGHGIFAEGVMFALEADGEIYLKADTDTAQAFAAEGCTRFTYRKGDRDVAMSYWSAPLAAHDDPEIMADWAKRAHACARNVAGPARSRRAGSRIAGATHKRKTIR